MSDNNPNRYRVALAAALLSIDLLIVVFGDVQRGPDWEVPAAVMGNFAKISMLAPVLWVVAAVLYFQQQGFTAIGARAKRGMQAVMLASAGLIAVAWLAEPFGWRNRLPLLSKAASVSPLATIVISGVLFWYFGFRIVPKIRLRSGLRAAGCVVGFVVAVLAVVVLLLML